MTSSLTAGPSTETKPLPLAGLHQRLGANFAPFWGYAVPESYGDVEAEYRALGETAAWVDRGFVDRLELTGVDRARLLGGLMTCDVKSLEPGQGRYGFFTGPQGKILADALVMALEDRLWLALPPGRAAMVADHIRKYIIADQVEVLPLESVLPVSIVGPGAEAVLESLGGLAPAGSSGVEVRRASVLATDLVSVRCRLAGQPAVTLWLPAESAEVFLQEFLEHTSLPAAGWRAYEACRVEAGEPAFGHDFDGDHFPQESGREAEAVDYTKGCYLGQEVVARIHYRGGVNRAMCRLRFEGALPVPGSALTLEGKAVGAVGSAVVLPGSGEALGLAVVHRRGFAPGTHLETAPGGTAVVTEPLGKIDGDTTAP